MKFKNSFNKIIKFAATMGALFTMVMSPVAMGREAQRITVKQLQQGLDEAGLNKQITVGEFYNKNKNLVPERLRKEFETFVATYKNQMMPTFEVVSSKATDGSEVASLRLSQGNEVITIQMLGETDKYAKIQNTYLTEVDVVNFNDMFKRILAGDEKYRKVYESAVGTDTTSTKGKFTGFPDLTVATWKGMSQKDRAAYMINMRLLWNDARRVLIEAERKDKKGRKTSAIDSSTIEKWDNFFAMFSPNVEAAAAVNKAPSNLKAGGVSNLVKQGKASSAFISGSNCLVAGYVSKYSATKCGVDGIFESYKAADGSADPLVQSVNQACSSVGIACNPYVYGTPGGKPICVSTTDPSFQKATHFDGPCDSQSRLGSSVPFLKDENLKNSKRYSAENLALTDAELDAKYKEEQKANPKMVEDYLNGLLAYNKTSGVDFSKPLTDEVLGALLKIKQNFDSDIKKAKESCELAASNKSNEKNFWGACDQLHRRFLNVAQFLQKTPGCKDGGAISEGTLKCSCPKGGEALPGASCSAPPLVCPVVPVPPTTTPATPPQQDCVPGGAGGAPPSGDVANPDCLNKYPGAVGLDAVCRCPGGNEPVMTADSEDGTIKHYTCVGSDRPNKPEKECGFLCKTGKFFKENWGIIAFSAISVFALYKILKPKKHNRSSPGDLCPNGSTAPCPQSCTPPLVLVSGSCGCATCPPGQTISDSSTCTCSTTSTTTNYTCPDGVTVVTNLANCPATNYTCWDGSTVTNPLNCPERPTTTMPSSGTGKVKK